MYSSEDPEVHLLLDVPDQHIFPCCMGRGCPISLFLFALAIEPLAIALHCLDGYDGIFRGTGEYKVP